MRNNSIDGFVRRRPSGQQVSELGVVSPSFQDRRELGEAGQPLQNTPTLHTAQQAAPNHTALRKTEIDESLNALDDQPKSGRKKRKSLKKTSRKKKIVKWVIISIVTILVAIGLYVGIKAFIASGRMFQGNLFGLTQSKPLQQDENGRSNILVFGTSEDHFENGVQHDGALLTDSMMVVSLNQERGDAFTFSIPRDLWVRYDKACLAGYEGKINAFYQCAANGESDSSEGADALRKKVGELMGLDIQYYAHVNYSVVEDAVDAVDGIEVDIEGYGPVPYGVKPGSILDRNFDWKCNYQCYYVRYEPGVHKLDGEHALALARARGASGGYGLQRSNFDREINQQKIAMALVKKAASVGTLTNVGRVTGLIDAMGANLRTNFDTSEIRTLMNIGSELAEGDNMHSISLIDAEPALFTTTNSDVRPVLGLYDFSAVQAYLKHQLSSDPIVREGAKIGVYNGTGQAGVARQAADDLEEVNFTVAVVGDAPAGEYPAYVVYALNDDLSATKAALEKKYGVTVSAENPPIATTGLDFIVIIGKAPVGQN